MSLAELRITSLQFLRDRVIGDSQAQADDANVAALGLISSFGRVGLGFIQALFALLPDRSQIESIFATEVWSGIEGQPAIGLVHRLFRLGGGNQRATSLTFYKALQVAGWDLAAKEAGLPLHRLLSSRRDRVNAFASGRDFHLSDYAFQTRSAHAASAGGKAFKIEVGHEDFARDLRRLTLLKGVVSKVSQLMVDANGAWMPRKRW